MNLNKFKQSLSTVFIKMSKKMTLSNAFETLATVHNVNYCEFLREKNI